ncbi:antichymotrypsin-2-like isoform X2 [Cylas formicarius]|uniref:antichymotrypsin-2-like isoform X2 n=1 Tax=Cylas formicarius TaxID=197179 RepID=UPI00295857F6|nr:antichymotrypsin-2-like isoform X2 [Cylas formicarius]
MKIALVVLTAMAASVCSETAVEEFAAGNLKFTAQLYKELLKENKGNFIVSPLSIEIILALTQAGARGGTAEEFTQSLSLPATRDRTEEALRTFLPTLKSSKDDLKLLSANKLFAGDRFRILDEFRRIANDVFEAGVDNVDFAKAQQAAKTINDWVEQHTNNKIKNLIDPDSLSDATRLVLVNALYFSAKWENQFEKYATRKEAFYTNALDSKQVDMMHIEDSFRYYECNEKNVKFLELPYLGGNISMTIVLPNDKEGLVKAEENIEELLKPHPLTHERVAVSLPKFLVESDIKLKPILQRLGLTKAFNLNEADLSGISQEGLYIDDVIQKAFINVTESGTEAAAATAVLVSFDSLPLPATRTFKADHPFLFFITLNEVHFFAGRVVSHRALIHN